MTETNDQYLRDARDEKRRDAARDVETKGASETENVGERRDASGAGGSAGDEAH